MIAPKICPRCSHPVVMAGSKPTIKGEALLVTMLCERCFWHGTHSAPNPRYVPIINPPDTGRKPRYVEREPARPN